MDSYEISEEYITLVTENCSKGKSCIQLTYNENVEHENRFIEYYLINKCISTIYLNLYIRVISQQLVNILSRYLIATSHLHTLKLTYIGDHIDIQNDKLTHNLCDCISISSVRHLSLINMHMNPGMQVGLKNISIEHLEIIGCVYDKLYHNSFKNVCESLGENNSINHLCINEKNLQNINDINVMISKNISIKILILPMYTAKIRLLEEGLRSNGSIERIIHGDQITNITPSIHRLLLRNQYNNASKSFSLLSILLKCV